MAIAIQKRNRRAPTHTHLPRLRPIASAVLLGLLSSTALAQNQASSDDTNKQLAEVSVTAQREKKQHTPGASAVVTQEDMEKTGSGGIADVVRYQPLVEAPGVVQGSTRGSSRYDRGGTTGYNIRGVEANRVGIDVDGVEMPDAVSRAPFNGRAQDGTFGMGRDFIDPYLYSTVNILSGTTNASRNAGGIGGAVGFRSKSASDFVNADKPTYFGARIGYDETSKSWHKGVTAAGRSGDLEGVIAYSRRDGKETQNDSDIAQSFPEKRNSDALLLKGGLRLNSENALSLSGDLYRRQENSEFDTWNTTATAVSGHSSQDAKTERATFQLGHIWTPANGLVDHLDTRLFYQSTDMDDVTDTVAVDTNALTTERAQNKSRQIGFSSVGEKQMGNHRLRFGVNASRNNNELPTQSSASLSQPYPDTSTERLGAFAEDTITWQVGGKRLALVPGLRVDRVSSQVRNTDSFGNDRITQAELNAMFGSAPANTIVSPSVSLLYDIQPSLTAYGQWKRSGRAPTNSEIFGYWNGGGGTYALVGDKDLKKETSDAFDFGLKGSPTPGVVFNGSVFYTKYKDFISYTRYTRAANPEMFVNIQDSLSVLYGADNRDTANIYGAEFSARIDHGVLSPTARGLYSTWAVGLSKGTSKSNYQGDKDVALDTVQPAKAIIGVGYDAPQKAWGLNLIGVFVKGKQAESTNRLSFSNDPNATLADSTTTLFRVHGYARFDLHGYWSLSKNMRIYAGIQNLTDKKHWNYSNARSLQPSSAQDRLQIERSTAPGRTYSLAMNIDF